MQTLHFKPHARLLTMLGDQLIKNERIALIEVIKNSYDADASWVKVTFEGFGSNFKAKPKSKIIIEDDGTGMTKAVLEQHWISPATPVKKLASSARRSRS
jgi:HSP90 family molecular chaperone